MRTLINLHCKHCGAKYQRRLGKEKRSKYCSRRCHALDLIAGRDNYPRWISAKERLPKDDSNLLILGFGNDEISLTSGEAINMDIGFTHWMPLPKGPK